MLLPVYAEYRDRGFDVVAISIDEDRSTLEAHRRESGTVPWRETWHPPERTAELRSQFEVVGIPAMVLVGPGGTVKTATWISEPTRKHPFQEPFAFALIDLDGCDTPLLHAVKAMVIWAHLA